ncbi:STM4015 family protein [Herbidospora sp. RD11066]
MRTPPGWETHDHHYAGYEVAHYESGMAIDSDAEAWWLNLDYRGLMASFFDKVDTRRVRALVCGRADDPEGDYAILAANAHRLPELRALFLGAAGPEQYEITWITQCDLNPLLAAFPRLERLEIRYGSEELALGPLRHEALKMLRIESGCMPGELVRSIGASDLPALEHLELWLGIREYGGDHTAEDLEPLLTGERLPSLRHLGLQNSERQDEIAAQVSTAPIVARLESLALSIGELTDVGAEALLGGQPLTHLRALDLHHNFLSRAMIDRLEKALPGVDLDLERAGDWSDGVEVTPYVAVAE